MSSPSRPPQYCATHTMRLYAFLLVAGAALCVRAASIPVAETEKKLIDIVPDNLDKLPENTSSEQELIDQANTIKDVDNKLRTKPENIPVEVIVENAQPALKDDEQDEEINRPVPDLRNPGPPQRQEHETQNPEYYASEQQTVALFKQSINEAQNFVRQGLQGIKDGIQHVATSNEPIQSLQKNIQSLRDGFAAQMVKIDTTIQSYLSSESIDKTASENTRAGLQQVEQGLFKLRNDFNKGVSTLADGVELVALLKADSEGQTDSTGASPAAPSPAPAPAGPVMQVQQMWSTFMGQVQEGFKNVTDRLNQMGQGWLGQNSGSASNPTVPAGAQSDSQVTSTPPAQNFIQNFQNQISSIFNPGQAQNQGQAQNPSQNQSPPFLGQFGSGNGFFQQILNSIPNPFNPPKPENQAPQGTQPAPVEQPGQAGSKPEEAATKPESKPQSQPEKPAAAVEPAPQAAAVTPAGPIRQILQNNPITQGIAGAVQRLQNINNPEKPRDGQPAEQVKNLDEDKTDSESKKGGGPNTGDHNDSSNSSDRLEQPEAVKEEIEKVPEVQQVPEVQKASEDEVKEHKTEEVADKTE